MKLVENTSLKNKTRVFEDREHAGRILAGALRVYRGLDPVVLAVPLGGIPVAEKIAGALMCPMDLVFVARLPMPDKPLAGFGAVTADGKTYLNQDLVNHIALGEEVIAEVVRTAHEKLVKRSSLLGSSPGINLRSKTAILVDDGLNSGYTLLAAVRSVKKHSPKEVVVAVPTASKRGIKLLESEVDTLFCPNVREGYFFSVLKAYRRWTDLTEAVVETIVDGRRNPH